VKSRESFHSTKGAPPVAEIETLMVPEISIDLL